MTKVNSLNGICQLTGTKNSHAIFERYIIVLSYSVEWDNNIRSYINKYITFIYCFVSSKFRSSHFDTFTHLIKLIYTFSQIPQTVSKITLHYYREKAYLAKILTLFKEIVQVQAQVQVYL